MDAFDAVLWRHDGEGGWYFLTLPAELSDDLAAATAGAKRGFGSVRVRATIGGSSWTTSLFPDAKRGAYLLPVKRQVREAEDLVEGSAVAAAVEPIAG